MVEKTQAIVVHTLKYNDKSIIVDMFTEKLGRLSFLVNVSHAKKSRMRPIYFQPLSLLEIEATIRPSTTLHRLKDINLLSSISTSYESPYKSSIAFFLSEFLYRVVKEQGDHASLFHFLRYSIFVLEKIDSRKVSNFHIVFLLQLSRYLGLYPNLDDYHKDDQFDLLNGCFVSTSSALVSQGISHFLDSRDSYMLLCLFRLNYRNMHLYKMNRKERVRCLEMLIQYYRIHLPEFGELRSADVLSELFDE